MRKILSFFFLCSLILLTGCSNIILKDNTVLELEPSSSNIGKIDSMTTEQPGDITSIDQAEKNIFSIGRTGTMYTIDKYSIQSSTLINLVTSDTTIFDVEATEDGFFYTKVNPSDPANIQIIWSTNDQSTERTITEPSENPGSLIYSYGKDDVIYVNNGNELVFADSVGKINSFPIDIQLEVSELVWSNEENTGFIIGRETGTESFCLYNLNINENQLTVNKLVDNVVDMDLNKTNNSLVLLVQDQNTVQVETINDFNTLALQNIFQAEGISKVAYNPDASAIYYSIMMGNGVRSTLWYYSLEDKVPYQITSPIRLVSKIIPIEEKNTIFFSVSQLTYMENSDIIQSFNYITKLVFET